MKVTFLGQGFAPNIDGSVGQQLINLFAEKEYQIFTGISAFASEAGVNGLASCILSSSGFESFNLIVGIDQEGTSKEALEEISKLKINAFIFYQKEQPIFHPKFYLFEGKNKSSIIIGSSNLTGRGLFTNVESSFLIEFNANDEEGEKLLANIKEYYKTLFNYSDPNLFPITSDSINHFVELGIIPLKKIWIRRQGKQLNGNNELEEKFVIPKRETAKLPESFKGKPKDKEISQAIFEETEGEFGIIPPPIVLISDETPTPIVSTTSTLLPRGVNMVEVWKSKPLSERDLNIPSGSTTNATGSMLLKKGLNSGIDFRHYFRDDVFANLIWDVHPNPHHSHLVKAKAVFKIIIDGVEKGEYNLVINHNTSKNSKAYKQKNAMTNLSWGSAKSIIAKRELLGKTLTLFKDIESGDYYSINIS